jgi:6-phosphogluconolactonase
VPVDRPDGLAGLTLTPPALRSAKNIYLIVSGAGKAEAVRRAVYGDEPIEACPVRLLAGHSHATLLLDESAASRL